MIVRRALPTGLVTAPQAEAAFEGARVLERGGNAADAAVTAALVQGVVDPHRCGLGGFGCITVFFPEDGGALAIDCHGRAGRHATPEQWSDLFIEAAADGFGYVVEGKVNDVGYGSITVPGVVAGLAELHRRFGRLAWRDLVLAATSYATDGFLVPPPLADFWRRPGLCGRVSTRERLGHTEAGRAITLKPDGEPYAAGEVFRQPLLAETYRRLAEEGPDAFYRGSIGEQIGCDWAQRGALVTGEDLRAYRPDVGPPLAGRFRGHQVYTTPLPGGGVALLQALALLEQADVARFGHNTPEYIDRVSRVLGAVWRDRLHLHGDPRFDGMTAEELLAAPHLARLEAGGDGGVESGADSASTTQISIVDSDHNAVSLSHSLGYGSGVFHPELGFMFNNCMSAFDPRPGARNSIAPGKARSTAIAETILLRDGLPLLVLGSPGAARITAGLVQVILNVVEFGMNAAEAVVQPRFDSYDDQIVLESRFPAPIVCELASRGWQPRQSAKPFGVVGRVYAIEAREDGPLVAGVDPGEPGAAFRGGERGPRA